MPNFKKPYFVVDFNKSICNFEILINDIPAFKSMDGGSLASHYPINQFILESGSQNISIRVLPLLGETLLQKDSYLKIKVHSFDSETQDYENLDEVYQYETPSYEKQEYPAILITDSFNAKVPFNLEGWKNSVVLENISEIEKQAATFYKKLHQLAQKDTESLFNLFSEKFTEVDEALYLKADNKKEWQSLLNQLSQEDFVLQPFPQSIKTNLYGFGKVVETTSLIGNSILYYKNKEGDEFSLPVLIHKKSKDSDFEIIR
ncbi:MAG: hypothetical protein ACTIJ9_11325 [Aequorivita sp.]